MPHKLESNKADFSADFGRLVDERRESASDVSRDVAAIIADVKKRGDDAVLELTQKFDHHDLNKIGWQLEADEIKTACENLPSELMDALKLAATRIRRCHEAQMPKDSEQTDDSGVRMGVRWQAVEAAGLYVPGGRAAYCSSVLMNAIPAKVAGVERLVMVTPTPDGIINPAVIAAAVIAEVDEIWRIGGAQAVAALASGTKRIKPVDVIVGPGNAWVAEAKRQLYGEVGIDMVAGPSEIVIVADKDNDPDWLAADLLSQAEHDPTSQSILISDSSDLIEKTLSAVEDRLGKLATAKVARESWETHGATILVESLDEAPALVNRLAPEHLELAVAKPDPLFAKIRHAGSVFLGRYTPEAIGDYVGGPNHVLPTGRRARFSSGLSVIDFMKRTTYLNCSEKALGKIGPAAVTLAQAEGLPAHAESVLSRLKS
ncbi:MAG: histidinol dehydrogenase [Zymomonas mobilis subsp. pomaceae]|uniref:Histidinol dehydrogenase n=1 Tax=Zymomonas mobilis subsp. pomaceae (strain ATCC 29192 / DSM 22645 / JCM 10191 / CCUG 17912 / NBRC 13757 / NCIMB 11200 / NRRL B-4491 / Barker I) TaxID=579138 RepID=F8EW36_ZYMMT|nr:histidinol dehydrogenase [Zymomonas mobilis]AEI38446.1 histidinol dehydrogenase [Zymomonas mobilis subsp. pomaceae ATCC 29192]MDX5948135.1 histidinol dehydrogenase [Zymomonas mobilis subsp. pomaceae]GEB89754.1 histidinol dehydrogenase [Zymomonas mobilis subsp. pomaceae]